MTQTHIFSRSTAIHNNNSFNTISGHPSKHKSVMVDYGNGTIANFGAARKQHQQRGFAPTHVYSTTEDLCEFQVRVLQCTHPFERKYLAKIMHFKAWNIFNGKVSTLAVNVVVASVHFRSKTLQRVSVTS